MEIPDLGSGILDVVARSAVVYLVLLALLRFGGKRHVGQLSIADLVLVLLIANGVQNAMVGENTTLIGGLAAALTLVVIDRVIDRASERSDRVRVALEGEPRILIRDGVMLEKAIREEGVTKGDLMSAVRQHGIADVEDVDLAVLETNGSISVIAKGAACLRVRGRRHRGPEGDRGLISRRRTPATGSVSPGSRTCRAGRPRRPRHPPGPPSRRPARPSAGTPRTRPPTAPSAGGPIPARGSPRRSCRRAR